jgi:hypothetical protein
MSPEIRAVDEVASRVLCLAALLTRAQAEFLIDSHEVEPGFSYFLGGKPEEAPRIIQRWVDHERLERYFSTRERIMMAKSAGEFTQRDRLDGWWPREALMVPEWSLRIIEPMPPPIREFRWRTCLRARGCCEIRRRFDGALE